MKRLKGLVSMLLALTLLAGLAIPGFAEEERPILRLAGGDTGLPNPFRHVTRGPGLSKMQLLYDSLLEKDEDGLIPWLAASWDVSEDGTVYTFYMRENALWHDGAPLTAEDVAFTVAYYREHSPVSNDLLVGGSYIATEAAVIDDYTVRITLNGFDNTYLARIGGMRILPKHIWEAVDDPATYEGEGAAVGSGPYMLESYDAQLGAYRYVAFDDYWGLAPAASAIEWVPVSNATLAFENGEIDLINAAADLVAGYEANPDTVVMTAPSYHSYRLMMNMDAVEALQDVNLRRAIAYAIDKQALVDKVARGAGIVSSQGYILPVSPWYIEETEQYGYDVQKAVELLAGSTYSFKLLTDNSADGIKVAELIALDLAAVGIEVTVEAVESKTRDNAVTTGEYELLVINSGGMGGDPDYVRTIYGAGATTILGWQSDEIEALAEAQAVEMDEAARAEILDDLQAKIAEEVPMIMLYGAVDNFVYRPAKYDGWMFRYDHSKADHNKLSYLVRE